MEPFEVLVRRRFAERVSDLALVQINEDAMSNYPRNKRYGISAHNDGREETADAIVSAMVETMKDEKYSNASYSLCFIHHTCDDGTPKINVRLTVAQSVASSSSSSSSSSFSKL